MEERNKATPKNKLTEALHPEIGNSSFWEMNSHFRSLRMVDPTKELEDGLISEEDRARILDQWSSQTTQPEYGMESSQTNQPKSEEIPVRQKEKGKKKHKKIHSVAKSKETEADWMKEEGTILAAPPTSEMPAAEQFSDQLTPDVEHLPVEKPGKRVRKVVRVAEQEQQQGYQPVTPKPSVSTAPMESALSPFTRWLKGLRGSEYVHPYEDDYALDQRAGNTKDGISETFADLLAAQGYRDQAIDMYRLLMAKYPEKSSFFAAKIEAL